MTPFDPFFQFLRKFVDLSEREFYEWIEPSLELRKFDRKQVILKEGEVEEYLNFLVQGMVVKYLKTTNSFIVTQLATEGHVILVQDSFYNQSPSLFTLQAIEPTILISIRYSDLEKAYSNNAKLERLGRKVISFMMVIKDRWQIEMIRLSNRERFLEFINRHPDLLQRVPQKYLASFLNIQPETFSRYKHLIKGRKRTSS